MTYTLEDYLAGLHTGQWFTFNGDKTYANVVVLDDTKTLPTEAEIEAEIQRLQAEYDAQEYARLRKAEYDKLNQFEMQFDDQVNGTTTWVDAINEIKARYPK